MSKTMYFDPQNFVTEVIKDMKLEKLTAPEMLELRQAIEDRLADRILVTVIDCFTHENLQLYKKLLEDHKELSKFDVIMMIVPQISGIREKLQDAINALYFELTYDAKRFNEVTQKNS